MHTKKACTTFDRVAEHFKTMQHIFLTSEKKGKGIRNDVMGPRKQYPQNRALKILGIVGTARLLLL